MPKGAPRYNQASTSLYSQDEVNGKNVSEAKVRAAVGDQGVAKLKAARKTMTTDDDTVSSSSQQDTPNEADAKKQAASDAMVAKLKAMAKKAASSGTSTVNRGLMSNDDED